MIHLVTEFPSTNFRCMKDDGKLLKMPFSDLSSPNNTQKFACMITVPCPDYFESHKDGCYKLQKLDPDSERTNLENLDFALSECNLHGSGLALPATDEEEENIIEYLTEVRIEFIVIVIVYQAIFRLVFSPSIGQIYQLKSMTTKKNNIIRYPNESIAIILFICRVT